MKLKAIIIEDEFNARQALKNMLEFYHPEIELIGESTNVKESVALLQKASPDLLFMDVRLPDGESFEIFNSLKARAFQIVFITAHDEYALKAIKLSALDYLLKPIKPKDLKQAVEKAMKSLEDEELMKIKIDTCVSNINSPDRKPRKIIINTIEKMHVLDTYDVFSLPGQRKLYGYLSQRPGMHCSCKNIKRAGRDAFPFRVLQNPLFTSGKHAICKSF